jgi:hypothetical protein
LIPSSGDFLAAQDLLYYGFFSQRISAAGLADSAEIVFTLSEFIMSMHHWQSSYAFDYHS